MSEARFEIPGRLDGLNEYINACRSHPMKGAKLKRRNQDIVCAAIKASGMSPVSGIVDVGFYWVEPNMRRDKDNIMGAHKFILDALVETGILKDDGWRYVRNIYDKFAVNKKNPRIIVTLKNTEGER